MLLDFFLNKVLVMGLNMRESRMLAYFKIRGSTQPAPPTPEPVDVLFGRMPSSI